MSEKKPPNPDEADDIEADRRFNETLGRMLKTPHRPHKSAENPKPTRNPREDS